MIFCSAVKCIFVENVKGQKHTPASPLPDFERLCPSVSMPMQYHWQAIDTVVCRLQKQNSNSGPKNPSSNRF